jgi:hypothetical protein
MHSGKKRGSTLASLVLTLFISVGTVARNEAKEDGAPLLRRAPRTPEYDNAHDV